VKKREDTERRKREGIAPRIRHLIDNEPKRADLPRKEEKRRCKRKKEERKKLFLEMSSNSTSQACI